MKHWMEDSELRRLSGVRSQALASCELASDRALIFGRVAFRRAAGCLADAREAEKEYAARMAALGLPAEWNPYS